MDTNALEGTRRERIEIFCCYAREDRPLLGALKAHLARLLQEGHVTLWADIDINAGAEWEREIHRHLNTAHIILLLISPDFMASEYCYSVEMKRALERHEKGEAKVIPIILRAVDWQGEALSKLQVLPTDGKPVTDPGWYNKDRAFYDVAKGIRRAVAVCQVEEAERARLAQEEQVRKVREAERVRLAEEKRTRKVREAQLALTNPPPVSIVSSRKTADLQKWQKISIWLLVSALLGSLLAAILVHFRHVPQSSISQVKTVKTVNTPDGRFTIGISDNATTMFTTIEDLKNNHLLPTNDTNNADVPANGEYCIYQQNRLITTAAHVTVVAVETLSATIKDQVSFEVGNASLQGLCQEQMNYNMGHSVRVRILVANIGTQDPQDLAKTMPVVLQQISDAARDSAFIGVVGFPYTSSLISSMDQFKKEGIPVISSTAAAAAGPGDTNSADGGNFSHQWIGYFYRVDPGDYVEGQVAATYAYNTLHVKRVLVLYDQQIPYSNSLGQAFQHFSPPGSTTLRQVTDSNSFSTVLRKLHDSKQQQPDMIFCACFDAGTPPTFSDFYKNFTTIYGNLSTIKLMGGDGLYGPQGNVGSNGIVYSNMYFTAYTFPDAIKRFCNYPNASCSQAQLQFYTTYCQTFAPTSYNPHASDPLAHCQSYGSSRPGKDTMLSYDALSLLLNAYLKRNSNSGSLFEQVRVALPKVSFQGITGWIQFNSLSSDPVNKMVLVLYVSRGSASNNGTASIQGCYGEFTQTLTFPLGNCTP